MGTRPTVKALSELLSGSTLRGGVQENSLRGHARGHMHMDVATLVYIHVFPPHMPDKSRRER